MTKLRELFILLLLQCCFPYLVDPVDCRRDNTIVLAWSSTLKSAPFTGGPLLYDLDGDGYNDIIAANVAGEVWAVHGESGHVIDGWPFFLENRSFHSTPLLYDIDDDGLFEITVVTSDAEILFLRTDGSLVHGEALQIPLLRMNRYWFRSNSSQWASLLKQPEGLATPGKLRRTSSSKSGVDENDPSFVHVDAHVLATPVLVDFDGDGVTSELIVPVSYYYDPYHYSDAHHLDKIGIKPDELVNYLVASVIVIDVEQAKVIAHKILDVTKASSDKPAYLLATPTVVKLLPESVYDILVGSSNGKLYSLFGHELNNRKGFPVIMDSITSQVAVHDIDGNNRLDIVVGDSSGNIACIKDDGTLLWEHEAQDAITASVRFGDVSGDGLIDVVMVTNKGSVWAVHGLNGEKVDNYPFHLQVTVEAPVLLLGLPTSEHDYILHTVTVDMTGVVNVIEGQTSCRTGSEVGALTYSGILVDDFVPSKPGAELLVATRDGLLVCLRTTHQSDLGPTEYWRSGQNLFTHKSSMFTVIPTPWSMRQREVSGRHFSLTFDLICAKHITDVLTVMVSIGNYELVRDTVNCTMHHVTHHVTSPTPPTPVHGIVTLRVCNKHMLCDHTYFDIM